MPKNDHNQLEELQNKINKIMEKWKSYSHNDVVEKADTLIQKYPDFKEHIEKGRDKVLEQKKEKQKAEQSTGQEQKMTSSSTTNQDQSPIKEAGARPKERKEHDEKRREQYLQKQEKCQKKKEKERQEALKIEQEQYVKYCMLHNIDTIQYAIVHTMCDNILRLYNEKNKSGSQFLLSKEHKKFKQILNCYIKLYATFTAILKIKIEFISSTPNFTEAKDKFKHLQEDQKAPFRRLVSILKKEKGKIKIGEIINNFNSIISILSKHIIDIPMFSYSCIPDVNNIDEIKNSLTERVPTLLRTDKREEDSIINQRFILALDNILNEYNYTTKFTKAMEEFIEQSLPSGNLEKASPSQNGACALVSCLRSEGKF